MVVGAAAFPAGLPSLLTGTLVLAPAGAEPRYHNGIGWNPLTDPGPICENPSLHLFGACFDGTHLDGRYRVIVEDTQSLAPARLRHRLVLRTSTESPSTSA